MAKIMAHICPICQHPQLTHGYGKCSWHSDECNCTMKKSDIPQAVVDTQSAIITRLRGLLAEALETIAEHSETVWLDGVAPFPAIRAELDGPQ